jgi:hypothetical protein
MVIKRICVILLAAMISTILATPTAQADAFDKIFGHVSGHSAQPFYGHKAQSTQQDLPKFWELRVRHTKKAKASDFDWSWWTN